jgi:hypothetical protein
LLILIILCIISLQYRSANLRFADSHTGKILSLDLLYRSVKLRLFKSTNMSYKKSMQRD